MQLCRHPHEVIHGGGLERGHSGGGFLHLRGGGVIQRAQHSGQVRQQPARLDWAQVHTFPASLAQSVQGDRHPAHFVPEGVHVPLMRTLVGNERLGVWSSLKRISTGSKPAGAAAMGVFVMVCHPFVRPGYCRESRPQPDRAPVTGCMTPSQAAFDRDSPRLRADRPGNSVELPGLSPFSAMLSPNGSLRSACAGSTTTPRFGGGISASSVRRKR